MQRMSKHSHNKLQLFFLQLELKEGKFNLQYKYSYIWKKDAAKRYYELKYRF
jgi:hypothetical protein